MCQYYVYVTKNRGNSAPDLAINQIKLINEYCDVFMKCCKTKTTVILTASQREGKYQRELINLEEKMLENMEMMLLLLL